MALKRFIRMLSAPRVWLPGDSAPRVKNIHVLHGVFAHHDAEGNLLWESDPRHNRLHDEGEQYILSRAFNNGLTGYTYLSTAGTPNGGSLFFGLDDRAAASVLEADTLASLSNEGGIAGGRTSGNGYSRLTINTDGATAPYLEIASAGTGATQGYKATAPNASYNSSTGKVSWTCSTLAWTRVRNVFLATHATATTSAANQRLIATVAMQTGDTGRIVAIGDTLSASLYIELGE